MSNNRIIFIIILYIIGTIVMAYKCQKLHIKYNQMFGTQIIPTYQKILMPLTSWLGYLLIIGIEPYHIKTLNEYETKCK